MKLSTLVLVVVAGCGRIGFGQQICDREACGADAAAMPAIDGAIGAPPGDAAAATSCLPSWLAHAPVILAPAALPGLSTSGAERGPWISGDGLRMYFAEAAAGQTSDIYLVTRASVSESFVNPSKLVNLSTLGNEEGRPTLTQDEKTLVIHSNRGVGGLFDVYVATRPDTAVAFGSPNQDHVANIDFGGGQAYDPFLSADGLRLYFAQDPNGGELRHIHVASRASTSSDFGTPIGVPAINTTEPAADTGPALSRDERIIVFSSARAGGAGGSDLYYATREDPAQSFGAPIRIPVVNGSANDNDPMLSADGCDLYFASNRSGDFDLFVAHVAP